MFFIFMYMQKEQKGFIERFSGSWIGKLLMLVFIVGSKSQQSVVGKPSDQYSEMMQKLQIPTDNLPVNSPISSQPNPYKTSERGQLGGKYEQSVYNATQQEIVSKNTNPSQANFNQNPQLYSGQVVNNNTHPFIPQSGNTIVWNGLPVIKYLDTIKNAGFPIEMSTSTGYFDTAFIDGDNSVGNGLSLNSNLAGCGNSLSTQNPYTYNAYSDNGKRCFSSISTELGNWSGSDLNIRNATDFTEKIMNKWLGFKNGCGTIFNANSFSCDPLLMQANQSIGAIEAKLGISIPDAYKTAGSSINVGGSVGNVNPGALTDVASIDQIIIMEAIFHKTNADSIIGRIRSNYQQNNNTNNNGTNNNTNNNNNTNTNENSNQSQDQGSSGIGGVIGGIAGGMLLVLGAAIYVWKTCKTIGSKKLLIDSLIDLRDNVDHLSANDKKLIDTIKSEMGILAETDKEVLEQAFLQLGENYDVKKDDKLSIQGTLNPCNDISKITENMYKENNVVYPENFNESDFGFTSKLGQNRHIESNTAIKLG